MAYNSTNTGAEIQAKLDSITPVTTTTNGLMTAADKTKLDGIQSSATAVSVTQTLTSGTEIATATINGTATKLYAPTATTDVFWATYGTTTAAELETAYQAGKMILMQYSSCIYYMSYRSSSTMFFFMSDGYSFETQMIFCDNSSWSTSTFYKLLQAQRNDIVRNIGSTSVTTLASVPTTYRLVLASLSAATTLSLASNLQAGQELHIICTPTASFTQPIPNSGSWISMDGSSLAVTSGVPFEINILYDSSFYRVKVITQS